MYARTAVFVLLLLLALPVGAQDAAPAESTYRAGTQIDIREAVPADLLVFAERLLIDAPVAGDLLAVARRIETHAPIAQDMRALGEHIIIREAVGGDLSAAAALIRATAPLGAVHVAGATVELLSGAQGEVVVYGESITLSGTFEDKVRVVASERIILAEGTSISGVFEYSAPQEAIIPASATIDGGISYIGSSAFLPSAEEAQAFALAGLGVFLLVRLVAAVLSAALIAGLFPALAARVGEEAFTRSWRRILGLFLLGLAVVIITPVLAILLLASFVGVGIAAIVGAAYLLLLLLAYLYAGVLAGAAATRMVLRRKSTSWRSAALGMALLFLLGLVPGIGFLVSFFLFAVSLGALTRIFYRFAFRIADPSQT